MNLIVPSGGVEGKVSFWLAVALGFFYACFLLVNSKLS